MRSPPESDYDKNHLAALNAEPWQVALLDCNPSYTGWGPGEDYMDSPQNSERSGWNHSLAYNSWKEFGPWGLDDLNEAVNFYFSVRRSNRTCLACKGKGLNPETRLIQDSFYSHNRTDNKPGWNTDITQDELDALIHAGRIRPPVTKEEVNQANMWPRTADWKKGVMSHDALNKHILVETRAKRLGVYGECLECSGKGYTFTEPSAHVMLTLWFLHPRKGASRGVEVRIEKENLPDVKKFLQAAAERSARRFSGLDHLR